MAGGFEGFINIAIPIIVVIFFGFILIRSMKKPLGELLDWIRGMFSRKKEEVQESTGLGFE
jgi:hypothetical protein